MSKENTVIDDAYLNELKKLCSETTPGPWYPRYGDDDMAMNCRWISKNQNSKFSFIYDENSNDTIAITLLQSPRLADTDDFYDKNMMFICEAKKAIPLLIDEVLRLRKNNGR